jgi:glycosyltransferase involved in cell wall biosynthesis
MESFHHLISIPYGFETSGTVAFANRLCNQLAEWGYSVAVLNIGEQHYTQNRAQHLSFPSEQVMLDWLRSQVSFKSLFWGGFFQDPVQRRQQIQLSAQKRLQDGAVVNFLWERTGQQETLPEADLFVRLIQDAADHVAVLNSEQKRGLVESGMPIRKVCNFSAGVDTAHEFFPAGPAERAELRGKFGWTDDQVVGLSIGRFTKRKRFEFMMEHWPATESGASFVLLGTGFGTQDNTEQRLEEISANRENLRIIKYRSGMAYTKLYRAADFFVSASCFEGEPTAFHEAMACELPIVASRVDGHVSLVQHEETGLLFDVDDATEFQACVRRIATEHALRMQLGQQARQMIIQQRDIRVVAARFLRMSEATRSVVPALC